MEVSQISQTDLEKLQATSGRDTKVKEKITDALKDARTPIKISVNTAGKLAYLVRLAKTLKDAGKCANYFRRYNAKAEKPEDRFFVVIVPNPVAEPVKKEKAPKQA